MVDTPEMYENGFHLYFKERINTSVIVVYTSLTINRY